MAVTKKKSGGSGGSVPTMTPPIIISGGRAWPGTFGANTGRTIWWENRDSRAWTVRFVESPFEKGRKAQDINVPAAGSSAAYTVERTKAHANYEYTIVGSAATGVPPGEPQVTIGD